VPRLKKGKQRKEEKASVSSRRPENIDRRGNRNQARIGEGAEKRKGG